MSKRHLFRNIDLIEDNSIRNLDIDECSLDGGHDCPVNADCVNTEGSFNCACSLGFIGDGRNCTGKD